MKTLGPILASAVLLAACRPQDTKIAVETPATTAVMEPKTEPLPEKISFNEHIQPILSENCYHCHGPDSGTREPKSEPLRLDLADPPFAPRKDGPAVIVRGDPDASSLMSFIRSTDPDVIMPPPASHKTMSPRDIAMIERWIEQGAEYQAHWSFIPPEKTSVPVGKNPIDYFIDERLTVENLTPNPPEELPRFFRRLHLDITGLPPSPTAAEAFLAAAKTDPDAAISAAADELLASSAAAENQARLWLDAARYADTHGIHIDNYRAIWPFRDWVIDAFQKNMPWDQFTVDQIAGDLLPAPTLEQKIATGFSRCMPTTGEGGAIVEEYEAIYAKDQVETVSAVWLGLTTGCAACHDHKFDPIGIEDFYAMTAFFRNTTMKAMDENRAEHPPNIFAPVPADRERWAILSTEIEAAKTAIADRKPQALPDFQNWLASVSTRQSDEADADLALHIPFDSAEPTVRGKSLGKSIQWEIGGERRDGPIGPAVLVNTVAADLGELASIARGDQVSYGAFVYIEGTPSGAIISRMDVPAKYRGWDFWLQDGMPAAHVIDAWPDAANKITAAEPLEPGKWHHVMVVFDGTQPSAQALKLFVNGKPVKADTSPNTVGPDLSTNAPLRIGSRGGDSDRMNGTVAIQDFRFYRKALSAAEIADLGQRARLDYFLAIPVENRTEQQTAALFDHYLATVDAPTLELTERIGTISAEQKTIRERGSVSLIMQEKPNSEPIAHVLERGVYSSKGKELKANVPSALPPMPEGAPRNRLGLANWLVDRKNPLTARVTVNRAWQQFFGTGIVESAGDFGIMGSRPTQPKLLDWLAVEFMDSGWDYRHILKLIVTSSTYRQSPEISPEKLEKDPYNRLLARGPRHRLDAEILRDMALSASGLLSERRGGPPVKPYQPEGVWESVAMKESDTRNYQQDEGESLYRRSVYTFWKRTAPPPSMEIFNAPAREVSCVRRDLTNTPLQALVMMNDPQFIEACRQLAAHAMKSSPERDARIDFITQRLLSRNLDPEERKIISDSIEKIAADFSSNSEAATALLTVGATPADPSIPAADLATWTLTASQILNLDETLTR